MSASVCIHARGCAQGLAKCSCRLEVPAGTALRELGGAACMVCKGVNSTGLRIRAVRPRALLVVHQLLLLSLGPCYDLAQAVKHSTSHPEKAPRKPRESSEKAPRKFRESPEKFPRKFRVGCTDATSAADLLFRRSSSLLIDLRDAPEFHRQSSQVKTQHRSGSVFGLKHGLHFVSTGFQPLIHRGSGDTAELIAQTKVGFARRLHVVSAANSHRLSKYKHFRPFGLKRLLHGDCDSFQRRYPQRSVCTYLGVDKSQPAKGFQRDLARERESDG